MMQIKEECQLCQTTKAARKQEKEAMFQAKDQLSKEKVVIPTIATASKGPKVAVPDKFDGTRGTKAEVYANQVGLYVVSNPTIFPKNRSRLVFLLSYLTGASSVWAQPFTVKFFDG